MSMPCASQPRLARKVCEVETVAASGIENDVARRCRKRAFNGEKQRLGDAAIVQPAPRGDGSHRVSRLPRAPLLRLQQVDVAATRDVERMLPRTHAGGAPRASAAGDNRAPDKGASAECSGCRQAWEECRERKMISGEDRALARMRSEVRRTSLAGYDAGA